MPKHPARRHAGAPGVARFVAYYRVSTQAQGASGLGLEAQRERVSAQISMAGGILANAFTEVETGKRSDRPQLKAALAECRLRHAVLIIAKLDRLARNTLFLLTLVEGLGDGGVVFCELPHIPPGPLGKFFLTLMAAVAELEAGLISERTKAALGVVKAALAKDGSWVSRRSGEVITALGNPNLRPGVTGNRAGAYRARRARTAQADEYAADVLPYIDQARKAGCVSLGEIGAALTARGIETPAGGRQWHRAQISRLLARATS